MSVLASRTGSGVWSNLRKLAVVLTAIAALLLISSPSMAQLNTGRISGQVTDQSGGAISGATVTVIDVARGDNRALTSDSAGAYAAPNLTPGIYTVRAAFMGFETIERQNIEVTVGGDVRVDLALQPGAQTQTVTVTESLPVINTTNAQTGGVLDNKLITDLPTIGRNYRWQQQFVPGVLMGVAGTGSVTIDVNGTTDQHGGNTMVDGLYDQTYFTAESTFGGSGEAGFTTILPLDAIQEINLVINPKAEYGWIPGVTASIGLKSGANDMHGAAYAFGRDTVLNARNAFSVARTPLAFEQWGGTLGGAIKKDKLFYYLGYESFRESATSVVGNIVAPSLTSGAGTGLSIPDAIAAMNTPGATHFALNTLSLNLAGCNANSPNITSTSSATVALACANGNQYGAPGLWNNPNLGQVPNIGSSDNGLFKLDYHINDHHSLNGSFGYGDYFEQAAGNSAAKIIQNWWEEVLGIQGNNMARVVEIWTPNSSWLNEARWGRDANIRPVARAECATNGDLSNPTGIGASTGGFGGPNYLTQYGLNSGAPGCGNPTIILSSPVSAQLGFSNSRFDKEIAEQGADSVSYTRAAHQFKFGVDIRAINFNGAKVLDTQSGVINFGQSGSAAFKGATSLESFLAGVPSGETIAAGSNIRTVNTNQIAVFAQDDWRIKPRLTLNLGLREEIVTPPTSTTDNLGNFSPSSPSGIVAVTAPFKTHYLFEPRVGLAWDVTGKGTTTVRAGGGVLNALITLMNFISGGAAQDYDTVPTGETLYAANGTKITAPGSGQSATVSLLPAATSTSGVVTPGPIVWAANTRLFPATLFSNPGCGNGVGSNPNPCSMAGGDPNLQYYHYIFWNVNLQHAFTNNFSVDVGYVGSRTTGIIQILNLNQAPTTNDPTLNNASSEQARGNYATQFPWFSSINYQANNNSDWYRSLQISLTERASHGLTFTTAYTYSGNYLTQGVLNVHNPISGAGPYSNNLYPAHNLSFTATYDIPGIKAPAQMLQGWQLHANVGVISGYPVIVTDTKNDLTGAGTAGLGTPWNLYGPADPFSQIFGRAGTIPCYGIAAGPTGSGITQSLFSKQTNCTSVLAGSAATPWANMPAACIAGATAEPSFTTGLAAGAAGTGLAQLAAVGCYMVNGSAIVPPSQGTYGSMLPDSIKGPGLGLLDASVTKEWKIKERYTTQFRVEAFNLLNRTQYLGGSVNLGSPNTFGLATNTPDVTRGDPIQGRGGPRSIQFGLKILF